MRVIADFEVRRAGGGAGGGGGVPAAAERVLREPLRLRPQR